MWWHCGIPVLKRQVFQGEHNCTLVVAAHNLCANRSLLSAYFLLELNKPDLAQAFLMAFDPGSVTDWGCAVQACYLL